MTKVRDIMTPDVVSVDPDDGVEKAIDLMIKHRVSGLPVVNIPGELVGVITEFDILELVDDPNTERNKVFHYMTRNVQVVDADATVRGVVGMFRKNSIRRFPVVSKGKLVGILSRRELIQSVRQQRKQPRSGATAATR